jgi:hypothetical protein
LLVWDGVLLGGCEMVILVQRLLLLLVLLVLQQAGRLLV